MDTNNPCCTSGSSPPTSVTDTGNAQPTAKELKAAYDREYRKRNADKLREQGRKRRRENSEVIKERKRRYRLANLEKVKEANRNYRENNPDKIKTYRQKHRAANRESLKQRDHNYYKANPDKYYEQSLKKRYGLTLEGYDKLLTLQGGKCAICQTTEPGAKRSRFMVDHDHQTGQVRGLLCHHCNVGLGYFKDSQEALKAALEYLSTSRSAANSNTESAEQLPGPKNNAGQDP